jgi:ABC-type antimicrobial peptide transport system permease subunit
MPVSALVSAAVSRTMFTLMVLGIAAIVAMIIGAMGIYGVIAYLVSLRTRELGVRLALGARPADVRRLVVRHGLTDAVLGVAAGLVVAAALTRVLATMLYDVSPMDPVTLVAASVVLLVTAVAASWLPARRAAALDPSSALRE